MFQYLQIIDYITFYLDSLLRSRTSHDHEATAMMKAQFMFLWDGLKTDPDKVVIVMGATNRPQDLDSAILRRMPATFRIPMPVSVRLKMMDIFILHFLLIPYQLLIFIYFI